MSGTVSACPEELSRTFDLFRPPTNLLPTPLLRDTCAFSAPDNSRRTNPLHMSVRFQVYIAPSVKAAADWACTMPTGALGAPSAVWRPKAG